MSLLCQLSARGPKERRPTVCGSSLGVASEGARAHWGHDIDDRKQGVRNGVETLEGNGVA